MQYSTILIALFAATAVALPTNMERQVGGLNVVDTATSAANEVGGEVGAVEGEAGPVEGEVGSVAGEVEGEAGGLTGSLV
jgi:hypothetical protein